MNSYSNNPGPNPPWSPFPPQQPRDNGGFAVASFVIGLVGLLLNFCCVPYLTPVLGILSLVFGFVSISSSKKGLAVAGIILGVFTIIFAVFVLAGFFAIFRYDISLERFINELYYGIFGNFLYY
jgi:hypothetical protein